MFNVKEELLELKTGNCFFCCACLAVKQITDQSIMPTYCKPCWEIIKADISDRRLANAPKIVKESPAVKKTRNDTPKPQKRKIRRYVGKGER